MALPTCECVKGLPIGEQLAAIYCATYTLAAGDVDGPYLLKAANLSDVADVTTSRTNLGAAASGANTDIDSLAPVGGNLGVTGTITSSGAIIVSNGVAGKARMGSVPADSNYSGIWFGTTAVGAPDFSNYTFLSDGAESIVNGATSFALRIANGNILQGSTTRITAHLPINLKGYTVGTLPAGSVGDTAYVTDAVLPAYNAALVGGGAVTVPVFFNGAAWVSA